MYASDACDPDTSCYLLPIAGVKHKKMTQRWISHYCRSQPVTQLEHGDVAVADRHTTLLITERGCQSLPEPRCEPHRWQRQHRRGLMCPQRPRTTISSPSQLSNAVIEEAALHHPAAVVSRIKRLSFIYRPSPIRCLTYHHHTTINPRYPLCQAR